MNEKIQNPPTPETSTGIASQGLSGWAVIIAFAVGFGYAVVRGIALLGDQTAGRSSSQPFQ